MDELTILTIPGSLRQSSYNRALLWAAADCVPRGVRMQHGDLRGVPPFDADREERDAGGSHVAGLRQAVAEADGLLFATPEYNQSIPGVLKNAIDWLSRATPDRVLEGKPVAIVGATTGGWGTRYAQQMLRHTLTATGCLVLGSPMLFVSDAHTVLDDGQLTDETLSQRLAEVVAALTVWVRTVASPPGDHQNRARTNAGQLS